MTNRARLVLASNNPGKIREFRDLLENQVEIVSLADLGLESPEETGATFEENATIKAKFLHEHTGEVTLADDSGLEVAGLNGAPGVRSARYAGDQHSDSDNRTLLLRTLSADPSLDRKARFVAAIVLIDQQGNSHTVRGTCEGVITMDERGTNGFGYDPIFQLLSGQTMAELTSDQKGAISHRGQAVREILPVLRTTLNLPDKPESDGAP
jgi:XTP/dITP diphosphohydrolase